MPHIAWYNYLNSGLLGKSVDIKHSSAKLKGNGKVNGTQMDDLTVLNLRRAYYASISYIDHLVGQILGKLKELGLEQSTVVSLLGDHGISLGENGHWTKVTNFDTTTRAPMMVHVPGKTDRGVETHKLVELVDLFPTIIDAAGLPPVPICPEDTSVSTPLCSEGTSLMPLITDPTRPCILTSGKSYEKARCKGQDGKP